MRDADERYFDRLESELATALDVANAARARGGDPEPSVEIPVAQDMADRVENILGIPGVAERVRALEADHSREEAALALVEDFVDGSVGDYDTPAGKIEGAVRTAVALLTEGVVAAPIEGIDRVEVLAGDGGTEFVNVYYAGPIRSAGGTAQALSVLVADYARALLGIDEYRARSEEVGRYAEEVALYDKGTGLQYTPSEAETAFIAEHLPIMLDGEPTGDEEVSGHRDLERVDTNSPRGGMCLVLAEGIALKAPKIQRYTRDLDAVDWPWLQDLIDGTYAGDGDDEEAQPAAAERPDADDPADTDESGPPRVPASKKYLRDLIAGRPVFAHPSEPGGFRLRYGRARNHGFATAGVHPATMHLVEDFLATGTQIKTERPGKAAGVVPVDTIEGPTVRLANGDVRRIDDPAEARELTNGVEAILDLGEYLVNYGEFVENNHPLAPASYTVEWWRQDFAAAGGPIQALRDSVAVDLASPDAETALEWASAYDAPLHPAFTYLWHDLSVEAVAALADAIDGASLASADGSTLAGETASADGTVLRLPRDPETTAALETLLVEHTQTEDALLVTAWRPLVRSLGFDDDLARDWSLATVSASARRYDGGENAIELVDEVAPFTVRERAPTRIGNRMGRPEKSETRELSPAVHTLFPIGDAGGDQRSVPAAAERGDAVDGTKGSVEVEVGRRACLSCGEETFHPRCDCGGETRPVFRCPDCERDVDPPESGQPECPRCGTRARQTERRQVDVGAAYEAALAQVGERPSAFEILKGVKGLSSAAKTPEPMAKGVLRAKHGVSAFKDGTVRYDMTDLPVTAVRPAELDVTAEDFRELGYETDIHGEPIAHDDQLIELKVQDVVLSSGAAEHLLQTADFVDDLLEQYYGLGSYYDLADRDDLIGELVFGMAPHTSAAVVGRVVGFTSAAVGYAHPYFHASKRRNCFHPETRLRYVDADGEWHHETVASLVEDHLEDPRTDALGSLVQDLAGDLAVPSLAADGTEAVRPVTAVSRHPAPDHLVEVRTRSGTSLTVTPDHEMLRYEDGIERVQAAELAAGDAIPTPATTGEEISGEAGDAGAIRGDGGDLGLDEVVSVGAVRADVAYTYCLTVAETHTLVANDLYTGQCDGDEDCVMLLLDGLLNFSKTYLPDQRGGRMDAPLVMSSRIDPTEIDDEAHNIDVVTSYPREFYEATRRMAEPEEVADLVRTAEASLGTDEQYTGFGHTHDTTDIAMGPALSAYKTLGSMEEKMDAQLSLARRLRAVDETDVAERVIEYHFLPDLIGNLRAFSRQEVRCLDCGRKYRRMPLTGDCRECRGNVTLTVHEGSVTKYMETARRIAEEYGAREYTKQRLEILQRRIDRLFEDDTNKQSGIADFM